MLLDELTQAIYDAAGTSEKRANEAARAVLAVFCKRLRAEAEFHASALLNRLADELESEQ